ncbi:sporulation protein YtxC [Paenibacillus sp. 1P07SE]|uniref:sporulation protein YtxC n=1 Tax=Paenibacillus sp. 1P07SE TaxID=3132209 RepID=UPI0039A53BEB
MELITIGMSPLQEQAIWKLSRCLSEAFAPLTMEPGLPSLHWDIDPDRSEIVCHATTATYSADKHRETLCRQAALGIAEYITGDLEPVTLRRLIGKHYSYQDPEDVRKIEEYCLKLLRDGGEAGSGQDLTKRKQAVAREATAYLMEHSGSMHIQGFLTFRLADYRAVLREIVQYAVDEFVMEKQYQDFLALLRYFVSTQEPRLPLVHLVHEEAARFRLYDSDFEPLEYQSSDRLVSEMLETEMQADDRIVSSLIASSPQRILIHTTEPELQVVATIESIFHGRVQICSHCRPGAVNWEDCRS